MPSPTRAAAPRTWAGEGVLCPELGRWGWEGFCVLSLGETMISGPPPPWLLSPMQEEADRIHLDQPGAQESPLGTGIPLGGGGAMQVPAPPPPTPLPLPAVVHFLPPFLPYSFCFSPSRLSSSHELINPHKGQSHSLNDPCQKRCVCRR